MPPKARDQLDLFMGVLPEWFWREDVLCITPTRPPPALQFAPLRIFIRGHFFHRRPSPRVTRPPRGWTPPMCLQTGQAWITAFPSLPRGALRADFLSWCCRCPVQRSRAPYLPPSAVRQLRPSRSDVAASAVASSQTP